MKGVELRIKTIAAILIFLVVALLIINRFLRIGWIWQISIVMMIIAVILYFIPKLKR